MSLHLTAADLAVVLGPVTGLLGLWLRLSWRTRQEHARRATLVDLIRALRPGDELVEHTAGGTLLRITAHGATVRQQPAHPRGLPELTAPSHAPATRGTTSHGGTPATGRTGATIIVDPNGR